MTRSCWNAWNYLRVRGEYGFGGVFLTERMELPPRARRIHAEMKRQQRLWGTTSACAENTSKALASDMISRNYLRVRGEYPGAFRQPRHQRELPPRARRILIACLQGCLQGGTTSACAENTLGLELGDFFIRNYLRVRGEYGSLAFRHDAVGELPPRARRIL